MTQRRTTILYELALAVLLLVGCGSSDETGDAKAGGKAAGKGADVESDRLETFVSGLKAFSEANLEDLLKAYTPEATWHMPSSGAPLVRGRKAVARQIVAFKGLLPESTLGIRRILDSGDWIVAQVVLHGTHRWSAQGIAREPRKVGYEMIYFVQIDETGKAAETIVYYDQTAIRRQLGHMKGAAPAVPKWPDREERVAEPGAAANLEKVEQLLTAVEQGDFDKLDGMVTADFTLHDRGSSRHYSLAEVKKRLAVERESFVAPRIEIDQKVGAGKYVALRFTQRSKYRWAEDTDTTAGEPVVFHGAYVFELSGGKIAALETYANEMELIQQAKRYAGKKKAAEADAGER
jgi:ketosteroid isomerase-like protein